MIICSYWYIAYFRFVYSLCENSTYVNQQIGYKWPKSSLMYDWLQNDEQGLCSTAFYWV